jgi:hypothetical protein
MRPNQEFIHLLNNEITKDPNGNYVIYTANQQLPNIGSNNNASASSTWWHMRTKSTNGYWTNTVQQSTTSEQIWFGYTGSTNDSTSNCVESLWNIQGGDGVYSFEVSSANSANTYYQDQPGNQYELSVFGGVWHYFFWNYHISTPSYIGYLQSDSNNDAGVQSSVVWVINGVTQKTVNFNGCPLVKIIWNKNTGMTYVYRSAYSTPALTNSNGGYGTLVGTYSVATASLTASTPFCHTGFILGATTSLFYAPLSGNIICNHTGNGLTMSNYNLTSSTPPLTQRMTALII